MQLHALETQGDIWFAIDYKSYRLANDGATLIYMDLTLPFHWIALVRPPKPYNPRPMRT
jgi:hypothetical protein